MNTIPTAVTEAETTLLQAIARDKHVLEIGALLGYSTIKLAEVAKRVVSIDPHEGYPEHDPRPTWEPYLRNLEQRGLYYGDGRNGKVVPIRTTWQQVFFARPEILYPYEVVFIDLTGKYEDTMECLRHFHPEFGWRLQTIAVHDCKHPAYPGVDRAIEEFKELLGMHTTFEQVDRLGVFRYV